MHNLTEWQNFGDVSPQYGQVWLRYGGDNWAEVVELRNAEETGDASDNVWVIRRGSIYFSPCDWDSALSCCDTGTYGPPTYAEVAYAFFSYHGIDVYPVGGFQIVQIGKRDSFGDETHYQREDTEDVILHGNANIGNYLRRRFLGA